MSTPAPPTPEDIGLWVQSDAIMLRNACAQIRNRYNYLIGLGEQMGGQNLQMLAALNNVASAYYGEGTIPDAVSYDLVLVPARRGQ
jgi:hypothetical protein